MLPPNLLLMIKPPPDVVAVLDEVRRDYGLDRSYAANKLHVTLLPSGPRTSETLNTALHSFRALAFHVVFDRVERAALKPSDTLQGLMRFRRSLLSHLAAHGIALPRYRFDPHITLSYTNRPAAAWDIDPISWRVDSFLLIESHAGRHTCLGRWPLALTPPSPARYRDTACGLLPSQAAP